jgi:hypothetical protein
VRHKRKGQEPESLYRIVVALRESGCQVWRGDDDTHIVDGEPYNTSRFLARFQHVAKSVEGASGVSSERSAGADAGQEAPEKACTAGQSD